jgi:hypothetical protein
VCCWLVRLVMEWNERSLVGFGVFLYERESVGNYCSKSEVSWLNGISLIRKQSQTKLGLVLVVRCSFVKG